MYNKFNELASLFSKEISQKGIVLYEADKNIGVFILGGNRKKMG
jgi:hypothetical protein